MALTDIAIRKAQYTGTPAYGQKLSDGGGLFIWISKHGKYWRLAYRYDKKQKTLALGIYPQVSLTEARQKREEAKKQLADGVDPAIGKKIEHHTISLSKAANFKALAALWFDNWKKGKSESTCAVKWKRLEADVFPIIGSMPIDKIETPILIAIVKSVNQRGARDVAERVLNTCSQIFRYAIAHGLLKENPATTIRPSDVLPAHRVKNQARVNSLELPKLMRDIRSYEGDQKTRIAMQLLALTFVRTSELIGAKWSELDLENKRWHIPAERMKMATEHIVPLSTQALALIDELRPLCRHSDYLFPAHGNVKKHMSNNTILFALYRMGYRGKMTGHGFRGVASTILHEHEFPHEHIELQLAHMERNKVSAAYNHATYLTQRAKMMQWWGDFIANQGDRS